MKKITKWMPVILLFALSIPKQSNASHCVGADLSYTCLGGLTYEVKLIFYRDCVGVSAPGTAQICYYSTSCGYDLTTSAPAVDTNMITPVCSSLTTTCNGGSYPGIEQHIFIDTITLPQACTDWKFSWGTCCRNGAITTGPDNEGFYVEACLNNVAAPCNSSPYFTNLPVPFVCAGQSFVYNHGATDIDNDSLSYALVSPSINSGCKYSGSVTYSGTYSFTNPLTSVPPMTFNAISGDITMNPTSVGEITVFAVRVTEWRNGVQIGCTVRDMQLYVESCSNLLPSTNGYFGTGKFIDTVCANVPFCLDIYGTDPDTGNVLTMTWNSALPGATFTTTGTNPVTGTFCWQPPQQFTGLNSFTVTIMDDACPYSGFQTYAYQILVGPGLDVNLGPDRYMICGGIDTLEPVVIGGSGQFSYLWGPGGDTTKSIIINKPATYWVNVDDTDACWGVDSIHVLKNINADFSAPIVCLGEAMQFIDSSVSVGGTVTNWAWKFGDGNSSTLKNPSNTYASPGPYTVQLIVTDNFGCKDTTNLPVLVHQLPTPGFTADTACAGSLTTFVDISIGTDAPIFGWSWDFGDGNTSFQQNPTHPFSTTGIFNVQLTVIDTNGCVNTTTLPVLVSPSPTVDFLKDDACEGYPISFQDKSTSPGGAILIWNWTFGDGDSSKNANPTHTYNVSGIYTVELTVIDEKGCTSSSTKTVEIYPTPVADYSFSTPFTPFQGDSFLIFNDVNFTDLSTQINTIKTWNWNFGDGGTSTNQNPTHQYTKVGTYQVVLAITSDNGCPDTVMYEIVISSLDWLKTPTAFSPNGDGYNDEFWVYGFGFEEFEIKIFNRWGEVVFESNQPGQGNGWNGMNKKGQPQPVGTYVFVIKAKTYIESDPDIVEAGNITLIR